MSSMVKTQKASHNIIYAVVIILVCFTFIKLMYNFSDYHTFYKTFANISCNKQQIQSPLLTPGTSVLTPGTSVLTPGTSVLTPGTSALTTGTSVLTPDQYNITGFPFDIVPNIIHYVLFNVSEIEFAHFIGILSVLKNQRPDRIYIHSDSHELQGDHWRRAVAIARLTGTELTVRTIDRPTEVFGRNLSAEYGLWHAADITRIQVLREFGGIYLDRDVYVIKNFSEFYKYEMTIDFQSDNELGSQVLIAHKNARFLPQYYETYRDYNPANWYYDAGIRPVFEVINKQPHIIHRMDGQFGCRPSICAYLFTEDNKDWKTSDYYSTHLLIRGETIAQMSINWCLGRKTPAVYRFNETIVESLNNTFGSMARDVLDFELQLLSNV